MSKNAPAINVTHLTMAYGDYTVMRDLNFSVKRSEIKIIMGGSGCGKSTLLKHLIGLERAKAGEIYYGNERFLPDSPEAERIRRRFGVSFQSGALWSSMTLEENVALPLEQYTELSRAEIRETVDFKLSLVGLAGFGHRYPAELSGGMQKRAGLARAIALDPHILFFDEPSAGLDPLSSRRLDDLILELRAALGATVVIVTHELASIFAIADSALFLDAESQTALCDGNPNDLLDDPTTDPKVSRFLSRGERNND
ncbi:ATP-binding cassette domain-containing protein [Coraliomargarita sp. SDUM461004]|uniref:ATP-binding cassette domain-containing protein n=1 Tax=Thalassobacterium sedimentorum TaxID=3041258 RepID=A0ABU1AG78_9BACT|nr:ATP-binding cassette domain-containing protein [Coraliomargarita sp. SDUM461004]MDQ8193839.1 ATP-binding cassette domain-containing protein [Coraliomargarita sp. SDUM461004]